MPSTRLRSSRRCKALRPTSKVRIRWLRFAAHRIAAAALVRQHPAVAGRHLPWVDRSGISIPSQHSLSRTSVPVSGASNESLDRTGRPRALPLPDVEFSVGNIYRRAGRRKTRLSQPRNQSRSPTLTRRSQNSSNGAHPHPPIVNSSMHIVRAQCPAVLLVCLCWTLKCGADVQARTAAADLCRA
eukprot:SAG11_NODE_354_length_10336_cov_3.789391_4_plen_185_part_00